MSEDDKKIPVVEMFGPTIQGEGAICGQVSYFIRFGLCGFRCNWCDSMHAVDPIRVKANAEYLVDDEIYHKIETLAADNDALFDTWVTLTGGDPVMWPLEKLVTHLKLGGFRVGIETQGQIYHPWLRACNLVTCSPKPHSSGMLDRLRWEVLDLYNQNLQDNLVFKVVIFEDKDFELAELIEERYPGVPLYLSAGTPGGGCDNLNESIIGSLRYLSKEVLKRNKLHRAIVGLQMHSLIWGRELGR